MPEWLLGWWSAWMPDGLPGCSLGCFVALAGVTALAGSAKGMTGFGAALVMAPGYVLLLPPVEAPVLIVLIHCMTSCQGIRQWHGHARWRQVSGLAVVALLSSALGGLWLAGMHPGTLRRAVGVAVLAMTAYQIIGFTWRHNGGKAATALAGVASGLCTAIGGLGGPPAVFYFSGLQAGLARGPKPGLTRELKPAHASEQTPESAGGTTMDATRIADAHRTLRANLLAYFLILFAGSTLTLAMLHRLTPGSIVLSVLLLPFFMGGVVLGEAAFRRMPSHWFAPIVRALMLISGLTAIFA